MRNFVNIDKLLNKVYTVAQSGGGINFKLQNLWRFFIFLAYQLRFDIKIDEFQPRTANF